MPWVFAIICPMFPLALYLNLFRGVELTGFAKPGAIKLLIFLAAGLSDYITPGYLRFFAVPGLF